MTSKFLVVRVWSIAPILDEFLTLAVAMDFAAGFPGRTVLVYEVKQDGSIILVGTFVN